MKVCFHTDIAAIYNLNGVSFIHRPSGLVILEQLSNSSTEKERDSESEKERESEMLSIDRARPRKTQARNKNRAHFRAGVNSSTGNCRVPRGCSVFRSETLAPTESSASRFRYSIISTNFRARTTAHGAFFNPLTRAFFLQRKW